MIKVTGSSNVSWYHYEPTTSRLVIGYSPEDELKTRVYSYDNVPPSTYEKLENADSKGEMVCEHIAYSYPYTLEGELDLGKVEINNLHAYEKIASNLES